MVNHHASLMRRAGWQVGYMVTSNDSQENEIPAQGSSRGLFKLRAKT